MLSYFVTTLAAAVLVGGAASTTATTHQAVHGCQQQQHNHKHLHAHVVATRTTAERSLPASPAAVAGSNVASAPRSILRWRGGATRRAEDEDEDEDDDYGVEDRSIKVTVHTACGSPHLDLKARFELKGSTTVGALKELVESQMKGAS